MIRVGDLLGGMAPAFPAAPQGRKTPEGLPLMVRAPDGTVGRIIEANATAARVQFEAWSATRGTYRLLDRESCWIPLRRLAPLRGSRC